MGLVIDGRRQSRKEWARRLIVINGKNAWLMQAQYIVLLHIARYQVRGNDWVGLETWHPSLWDNVHKYTYLLRKQLRGTGLGIKTQPRKGRNKNSSGGYRIDIPVRQIKIRPLADIGALLAEVYQPRSKLQRGG
jgi:hypothetical protein